MKIISDGDCFAAAIGSGEGGYGTVTVNNGVVNAGITSRGAVYSNAIGGGMFGGGTVEINCGVVNADIAAGGSCLGAAIGNYVTLDYTDRKTRITASSYPNNIRLANAFSDGFAQYDARTYSNSHQFDGKTLVPSDAVAGMSADTETLEDGMVYAVSESLTNGNRLEVQGDATLLLGQDATLTLEKGIHVGENNSLTIRGDGKLIADAEENNAAIGGDNCEKNGAITIEGGEIIATGGENAAGIGGGCFSQPGCSVTISGGKVSATGKNRSAGIGGGTNNGWNGHYGSFGDIIITGGIVTAYGSDRGAGIGGGSGAGNADGGNVGTVSITGGQVTAVGGTLYNGYGIGPGLSGLDENGTIDAIVLGYTKDTDFIEANSFGDSKEKISFVERKTLYHADTAEQATAEGILDGCKLVPSAYFNSDITYATVADVEDNYAYTGENITVTPTLKDFSGNSLKQDSDYTVKLEYDGNEVEKVLETGKYTYTFTGTGNYSGNTTKSFEVITQAAPSALTAVDVTSSSAELSWTDKGAAKNWTVEYGTDSSFSSNVQSVTVSDDPYAELKDLQEKTTYFARVKSVIGEVSSDWNDTVSFTTRENNKFVGHSLTLGGSIGVNFFLELTEQQAADNTVTFEWTVKGEKKTFTCPLTHDALSGYYLASCPIAAAEMTYQITAKITVDGEEITDTYSAAEYSDVILAGRNFAERYIKAENAAGRNGEQRLKDLRYLVKTMLDYGAKAQKQFKRDTEVELANKKLVTDDQNSPYYYVPVKVEADSIVTGATDMYAADFSKFGLEYKGSTIVCLSETSLRHYFEITDQAKFDLVKGNISFGSNDKIDYTEKNGEIYFELKDIAAAELDNLCTLSIGGNSYLYSVVDYIKACLLSEKTSDNMKELSAALYRCNQAANTYFDSQGGN